MNRAPITVITPLLNRSAMLPKALASVAAQRIDGLEHLIVDGGSTDASRDIARAAGATVIDAPGSAIYEAINIGLDRAHGDLICLLNSDDHFVDGALSAARVRFRDNEIDFVRGRAQVERLRDGVWTLADDGHDKNPSPTLRGVLLQPSNINACLFRAALIQRVGQFDTRYPISADREWLARALLSGARCAGVCDTLYIYRAHVGSATIGGKKPATERWVREHLAFARCFLSAPNLARADRAALLAFHAKESAHLAALLLGQGKISASAVAASFQTSPLWPLHAAGPLAAIAAGRLRRAFSA